MAEPRKQFTFYRSYYDAIQGLPQEEQAAIILAVCAYAIYEQEPAGLSPIASTAFQLIRPTLDTARKKAESGKIGGSKPKASVKQTAREIEVEKEIEKENEVEVDVEGEEYSKEYTGDPSIDLSAAVQDKKLQLFGGKIGRNAVYLSQEQIADLLNRMDDVDLFDRYVSRLADCIVDKGYSVKSHYQTILKWWREDSQVET